MGNLVNFTEICFVSPTAFSRAREAGQTSGQPGAPSQLQKQPSPAVCQNRERAELWVTMSEVPSLPTNIAEHPELRWRQALSWLMIQLQSGARFPCLRRPLRHHPHSACAVPTVCAGGLCSLLPCTAKHGQQLPGCTLQMGEAKWSTACRQSTGGQGCQLLLEVGSAN